jgi:hypothetical protein
MMKSREQIIKDIDDMSPQELKKMLGDTPRVEKEKGRIVVEKQRPDDSNSWTKEEKVLFDKEKRWKERLDNAQSPGEVQALLRSRPKGAKNIRSGGAGVSFPSGGNLPVLNKFLTGKGK